MHAADSHLTARQAADRLGVRRATLYAYVSRGLIRSEAGPSPRERFYRREDVEALRQRHRDRKDPERALQGALHWGSPLLDSSITTFSQGRCFYRGREAVALSRRKSFEDCATFVWQADPSPFTDVDVGLPPQLSQLLPHLELLGSLERLQTALPILAACDPGAWDVRPAAVQRTAARLLRQLAALVAAPREPTDGLDVVGILLRGWRLEGPAGKLLDATLVLCLDHELNVSSFTARCVASAGANLHAVVGAGLSALQGVRHGGHTRRVEALWNEVGEPAAARRVLAERLRRGESVPGLGQPLYPSGDPRYQELRHRVGISHPEHPALHLADAIAGSARELLQEEPTVDAGLVLLRRVLGLPPDSALALFGLGRAAGWIAHALEQQATGELIRPRARYVGPPPEVE